MSELQTLFLDNLRDLRREFDRRLEDLTQAQTNQAEAIKTLEARRNESEKTLRHLSELYNRLLPLIEAINNDAWNGPR